jgi:hypothetical protein
MLLRRWLSASRNEVLSLDLEKHVTISFAQQLVTSTLSRFACRMIGIPYVYAVCEAWGHLGTYIVFVRHGAMR